jgi:hypothetical protein
MRERMHYKSSEHYERRKEQAEFQFKQFQREALVTHRKQLEGCCTDEEREALKKAYLVAEGRANAVYEKRIAEAHNAIGV